MPKYKIADLIFEINLYYQKAVRELEPYLFLGTEPPKSILSIKQETLLKQICTNKNLKDYQVELMLLTSLFNVRILDHNILWIHASAIEYDNKAYLFAAPSGIGKSTHTKLWKELLGDEKVKIINDDNPVVRFIDDTPYVYGTPFTGGTGIQRNVKIPLESIVFIAQSKINTIEKLQTKQIITNLLKSTSSKKLSYQRTQNLLNLYEKLIQKINFYQLNCNTTLEAAILSFKTIVK